MDHLRSLISSGDIPSLITHLEGLEQSFLYADSIHSFLAAQPPRSPRPQTHSFPPPSFPAASPHLIYALLTLAHCADDDLPSARFALKRIPESLATQPLLQAVDPIFGSLWYKEVPKFWETLSSTSYLSPTATVDPSLSEEYDLAAHLTRHLAGTVRHRTKVLLEKAYTAIRVRDAVAMLGLSKSEVSEALAKDGWTSQDGYLIAPERGVAGTGFSASTEGNGTVANGNGVRGLAGTGSTPRTQIEVQRARDILLERMKAVADVALKLEM
ncbi:hypothetical protein M427DRAFT_52739 [Gonapodya prolifera JEL478]|uniref:CSN8/PSMD8/EIF3K domain-containing protein n=1 Tax=Gonapodya prolifera (strain JEL478) TaxID=1344416 RepID=A0A139AT73_GONPJ|nr:hypothetical protein M427DRAFT_52739 [Gonapodya prolifera JEL478]|eukprot:KXS19918.1 hypothetical protein M427DRAFT_52739 [Gonapodya prolifera JEL478]